MQAFETNREGGYIALISVIIMSAFMIALTVAVSQAGYLSRFSILHGEFKDVSTAYAEGCVRSAAAYMANQPGYIPPSGGELVTVGSGGCRICSAVISGAQRTVQVRASYQGAVTNLTVILTQVPPSNPTTTAVTSWVENSVYTGPNCSLP